jgi:DNA repair protein RadC
MAGYKVDRIAETVVKLSAAERRITGPKDVSRLAETDASLMREQFRMMLISRKNTVIADKLIAVGSLDEVMVHPREVLKPAILASAASIILYHNHPSGDPLPSAEDIAFTRRIAKCCELMGIELLDHVVIGASGSYSSIRERCEREIWL